jgi:hypothetical protein
MHRESAILGPTNELKKTLRRPVACDVEELISHTSSTRCNGAYSHRRGAPPTLETLPNADGAPTTSHCHGEEPRIGRRSDTSTTHPSVARVWARRGRRPLALADRVTDGVVAANVNATDTSNGDSAGGANARDDADHDSTSADTSADASADARTDRGEDDGGTNVGIEGSEHRATRGRYPGARPATPLHVIVVDDERFRSRGALGAAGGHR